MGWSASGFATASPCRASSARARRSTRMMASTSSSAGATRVGSGFGERTSVARRPDAPRRRAGRRGSAPVVAAALRRAGPTTPKPEYSDTPLDRFWLRQFHRQVARELGDDPSTATGEYDATMARCVRLVSSARTPAEAQARGERVLRSLLPPGFAVGFKIFISLLPEWFVARHAARVTPFLLPWLVGPSKVIDAPPELPVDDQSRPPANAFYSAIMGLKLNVAARRIRGDGSSEDASSSGVALASTLASHEGESPGYKQGVLLERCRVLEEGGCASVCLNVCKLPTQAFFNDEVGLAVTLQPDYETFECRFVYGKTPPPPEEDEAFNTPCFGQCPITKMGGVGGGEDERDGKDDDALGTRWAPGTSDGNANCSRLPAYVGEGAARNHGGKGT